MAKKRRKQYNNPTYDFGGFLENTGEFLGNTGKALADTALGTVGLTDVIKDNAYKGTGAKFGKGFSDVATPLTQAGAMIAGNVIAPGIGGAIVTGTQAAGKGINRTDLVQQPVQNQQVYAKMGGYIPQFIPNNGLKHTFHMGGETFSEYANSELEKQENVVYPNGVTQQFDGPSHEEGGIPTNLSAQTRIFSDKLRASSGKTFAKEAKKFSTDKFSKTMNDDKADKLKKMTAELMFNRNNKVLDNLFNEQESLKQVKVAKYAAKHGYHIMPDGSMMSNDEMRKGGIMYYRDGGLKRSEDYGSKSKPYPSVSASDFAGPHRSYPIPTEQDAVDALRLAGLHGREDIRAKVFAKYPQLKHEMGGLQEYRSGGTNWIQGAVNPAHKGYCTPMTKATCTPHRKALAMTFKKHHGFHQNGGVQTEEEFLNTTDSTPSYSVYDNYPSSLNNPMTTTGGNISSDANPFQTQVAQSVAAMPQTQSTSSVVGGPNYTAAANANKPFDYNNALPYAGLLPGLYNLGRGIFDKPMQYNTAEYQTPSNLQYRDVNFEPIQQSLMQERRTALGAAKSASAGNAGTYLSNAAQIGANTQKARANALMQAQQYNLGNRANIDQANLQNERANKTTAFQIAQMNEANRQAKGNMIAKGLTDIGRFGIDKFLLNKFV